MKLRSNWLHYGVVLALIAAWYLLRDRLPWKDDFWTWANRGHTQFGGPLAIASVLLLSVCLLWQLWFLFGSGRSHRAGDAQGIGCLTFVAYGIAAMLVILIVGIGLKIHFIIKFISSITLGVSLVLVLGLITEGIKALRKKFKG